MHEEFREITTQPIQKIMGPIRNAPLFSKAPKAKHSPSTELTALVGISDSDMHAQPATQEASAASSRSIAGEAGPSGCRNGAAVPFKDEACDWGHSPGFDSPVADGQKSAPGDLRMKDKLVRR